MKKLKFVKAFIIGMCITVLSSTAAFAETVEIQQAEVQVQQTTIESSLLEKQKEIDRFVFDVHAKEIADKGFKVTNTGPVGSFVEIGISPFNEENAEYLYNAFGRDMVKVVQGQQAMLMATAVGTPDDVVSTQVLDVGPIDENILNKQREIDQYVFEQHKAEISEKGFKVTHTGPFKNYVEIGIVPYNDANADYLYEIFGRDIVKVVEGQQAVTMANGASDISAELYASNDIKATAEKSNEGNLQLLIVSICALGAVIVLGFAIVSHRRKVKLR